MGHTLDPATGKPTFNNTPSTVSDLQGAADYAERLGGAYAATVGDLEDIEYPRKGEQRWVEADGGVYVYDGSGWVQAGFSHIQLDTTNSVLGVVTQYGMGKIASAAAGSVSEAVTFPKPFASIPFIDGGYIGGRNTVTAFNPAGLIDVAGQVNGKTVIPSLTGLTVMITRPDANLPSGWDLYYSWRATGVLA